LNDDVHFTILADGRVPSQRPFGSVVTPGPTTTQEELAAMFAAAKAQIDDVESTWAGDISFALDALARENTDARSALRGHLDLARVGVFGHSLGGIAAVRAARRDRRLRAIVSLDGAGGGSLPAQPVASATNEPSLDQPVLMISASSGMRDDAAALRGATRATHIRLLGAAHPIPTDFGVLPLPRRAANAGATIDATRARGDESVYARGLRPAFTRGEFRTA
jgi:pimeloyl-ACP methyl ester carboxylesterase